MRRRHIFPRIVAGPVVVALALAGCADQGDPAFPDGEVTMIVGYPAGSAPDSTARNLAQAAEKELGTPIVIVNRDGGSGTIGLAELAKAEPDGHAIGYAASPALTLQWQRLDTPFRGPEELDPVIMTTSVANVLFARADSGIDSLEAFVQRAREQPGKVKAGIPGDFSVQDIQMRSLAGAAGISYQKVRFDAGKQVLATVNKTVDVAIGQPALVTQYVKRGDLKVIGVFAKSKLDGIDAPLVSEAGFGQAQDGYEGIVAPKGTPADRVQALHDAFKTAMASDSYKQYLSGNQMLASYASSADFGKRITDDSAAARELIKNSGKK